MSTRDPSFVVFSTSRPGPIGEVSPSTGKFTQLTVLPEEEHAYGVKILVAEPTTDPSPEGALKIEVASSSDTNPALNIDNLGTGPDIQLDAGVTISEVGGELVFTDTVAGSVALSAIGGTASNENVGGIGVFEQKLSGNFEFRGIAAASPRVTVVFDAPNKKIDVDVDQSQLVLLSSQISNFDTSVAANAAVAANTAKISADLTINYHSDVDITGVADGMTLVYNSGEFVVVPLSAANVTYDDSGSGLGSSTVQGAIVALDTLVDALEINKGNVSSSSIPSSDNRLARYDGTTGKVIQQAAITVNDLGYLEFLNSGAQIKAAAGLSILPTQSLNLQAGDGYTGTWKHGDGSDAFEVGDGPGDGLLFHDKITTGIGESLEIVPTQSLTLLPGLHLVLQAGTSGTTTMKHGSGALALQLSATYGNPTDGVILLSDKLIPGGSGRTLGHVSATDRQFDAVYSQIFSGGSNYDSTVKAAAGRDVRLESADSVVRVEVDGDTGNVRLNAPTFVNNVLSVYSGSPASSISTLPDRHQIFMDTDTGELSIRKISGDLVSLESGSGGTGGGLVLTVGRVSVDSPGIPAGTTVTASNTTQLTDAPNGLVAYQDSGQFASSLSIYVGGLLVAPGVSASSDNDVYPAGTAANGEMAFEFDLAPGTVIQIIKLVAATP